MRLYIDLLLSNKTRYKLQRRETGYELGMQPNVGMGFLCQDNSSKAEVLGIQWGAITAKW